MRNYSDCIEQWNKFNFKKFELTENETKESVFKKAMKENVLIFKKHLAEKWMEELENDY